MTLGPALIFLAQREKALERIGKENRASLEGCLCFITWRTFFSYTCWLLSVQLSSAIGGRIWYSRAGCEAASQLKVYGFDLVVCVCCVDNAHPGSLPTLQMVLTILKEIICPGTSG